MKTAHDQKFSGGADKKNPASGEGAGGRKGR